MKPLGKIPQNIKSDTILSAVGENIILADENYDIIWLNPAAVSLLRNLTDSYGVERVEDLIGMNMDKFHKNPARQQAVMEKLESSHRARINIKDKVTTDIVIDPIHHGNGKIAGYVVMLMDVTSKAQEEEKQNQIIQELSVPLFEIWDRTLALPLIGKLDMDRFDLVLTKLMDECKEKRAYYVVIDLSGVRDWDGQIAYQLERIISGLDLMGTTCMIAGISPKLARQLSHFERKVPVFPTMKAATRFIISS